MRPKPVLLAVVLCLWTAGAASAVTVDQIVSLSKAGVSEAVILALIDRDQTVLTIDPEQIVSLKREGLSDTLITAMLKSGRDEADQEARAVSSWNASTILSGMSTQPEVVIVGHGPDRPNTIHTEDWYSGFRDGVALPSGFAAAPYAIPAYGYGVGVRAPYRNGLSGRAFRLPAAPVFGASEKAKTSDRALCLAQVNTPNGAGPSYVTECPAVMQRSSRTR